MFRSWSSPLFEAGNQFVCLVWRKLYEQSLYVIIYTPRLKTAGNIKAVSFITSGKEVTFLSRLVCLFVYLRSRLLKSYE